MTKNKIYDFVVIGSGPAGSVVSWNLANEGFKIAIMTLSNRLSSFLSKND